jgi:uncharacterized protein
MIAIESRAGRRIVGRLDRGASLFEALLGVCRERRVRTAEVRALGSVESVEVAEYDQAARVWKPGRTFAGGLEVVHLTGNVSERDGQLALHAHASLMRERDNGVELVGGHLLAARVFALEFVIDAFDDVILRRSLDPTTGLTLWSEALSLSPEAAPPPPAGPTRAAASPPQTEGPPPQAAPFEASARATPAAAAAAPTWAQVAQVSAQRPEAEAEDHDQDIGLEPGDILIHPTFGRCEVQRIEGGDEYAHIRLKNGRLVRLSLDILKLARQGTENSRRVFRARIDD